MNLSIENMFNDFVQNELKNLVREKSIKLKSPTPKKETPKKETPKKELSSKTLKLLTQQISPKTISSAPTKRGTNFSPINKRKTNSAPAKLMSKMNKVPSMKDIAQIPNILPDFIDKNYELIAALREKLLDPSIHPLDKREILEEFAEKHRENTGLIKVTVEELHEEHPHMSLGELIIAAILMILVMGYVAGKTTGNFEKFEQQLGFNIADSVQNNITFDSEGGIVEIAPNLYTFESLMPITSSIVTQIYEKIPSYDQLSLITNTIDDVVTHTLSGDFKSVKDSVSKLITEYNRTAGRFVKQGKNVPEKFIKDPIFQITKSIQKLDPLMTEDTVIRIMNNNIKTIRQNYEKSTKYFKQKISLIIAIYISILGGTIMHSQGKLIEQFIETYLLNHLDLVNLNESTLRKIPSKDIENWHKYDIYQKMRIIEKIMK